MTAKTPTWRVGMIGLDPTGLYLLERLSLRSDLTVIETFDDDPARCAFANHVNAVRREDPNLVVKSTDTDVLFFTGALSAELVSSALNNGKQVVIYQPWRLTSQVLCELSRHAISLNRSATVVGLRRWSPEFLRASAAKMSRRLGTLQTIRYSSCEQSVSPADLAAGVLREFGYDLLDQLLLLADSTPQSIHARQFVDQQNREQHGFSASVNFVNGCHAQIELQTRSRLSHRTGWMIEGTTGSYRSDRVYTTTLDGEIIDEPLVCLAPSPDHFLDQLIAAWNRRPNELPTLADASRVTKLIEEIELSASSGESVAR